MVFNVSEVHNLQLVAERDSEFGGGDGFLIKFALWSFFYFIFPLAKKTFYYSGPLKQSHYCGSVGSVRGTLVLIVFLHCFSTV